MSCRPNVLQLLRQIAVSLLLPLALLLVVLSFARGSLLACPVLPWSVSVGSAVLLLLLVLLVLPMLLLEVVGYLNGWCWTSLS